jgi:hypothetical protein
MKALYISSEPLVKDLDLGYLTHFADKGDIIVMQTFEEAKRYILRHLCELQQHLDFIIVDMPGEENEVLVSFALWIFTQGLEYSRNNFWLGSIPLILTHTFNEDKYLDESLRVHYTKVIYTHFSDEIKQKVIGTAISQWMQDIGSDLDHFNLDLRLRFDKKRMNWLLAHRGYNLKVLTETFFRKMEMMPYLWFGSNLKALDASLNGFYDLLRKADRLPTLRNEKEIHQYLIGNKRLLLGEFYSMTYYEKQFYIPGTRRYVENDFTNMAHGFYDQAPEIFEVKLPSQRLIRSDKKIFYRNTVKAIEQVTVKYAGYFSDPQNKEEIYRRIGYHGNAFDYTLLIGRKRDKEENQEFLLQTLGPLNLRLLAYDELADNYQRLYERTMRYRLS